MASVGDGSKACLQLHAAGSPQGLARSAAASSILWNSAGVASAATASLRSVIVEAAPSALHSPSIVAAAGGFPDFAEIPKIGVCAVSNASSDLQGLTGKTVEDFIGGLAGARTSFDKLDWKPRLPVIEQAREKRSDPGRVERRCLQRIRVRGSRPLELEVGGWSEGLHNDIPRQKPNNLVLPADNGRASGAVAAVGKISSVVDCSTVTSEAGNRRTNEEARVGSLPRAAATGCQRNVVLPRIQTAVPSADDRMALFSTTRRLSTDVGGQPRRRGLLVAAAQGQGSMVDSSGRSKSVASFQ